MAHFPVNHHLRPLYRALAGLAGLYVLLFGIVGFVQTSGKISMFDQHGQWVLGIRANPAFALLSIVAGAIIVVASLIGRNIDHFVYIGAGVVFMVAGMTMLVLLETNANFLGFSMTTCIVSFVLGTIYLTAGLYTKAGSREQAQAEDAFRHRSARKPAERSAS
jgi:uncharacterized protein DUF4383